MGFRPRAARRAVLRALGLGGAYLPLVGWDRPARAGCLPASPKRLVIVKWPNGVTGWPAPAATPAQIQLPAYLAPLEPFKADCTFINGLRFKCLQDSPDPKTGVDGHASAASILTGKRNLRLISRFPAADGISVDQFIAEGLEKRGYRGLPSLNLGVWHLWASMQWKGSDLPVWPDNDPYHVFDTLFAGGAAGDPAALERLRQKRKSVLDFVGRDLTRFGKRVGAEDRQRVDGHLQAVRDIEKQLAPGAKAAASCGVPTLGARLDLNAVASIPAIAKVQMDLGVAALASDMTRIVVMQIGNDNNNHMTAPWLGFSDSHHDVAHNGPTARKARLDQWYYELHAHLLGKLKEEKEAGRPMLDSAAVVLANNMTHGLHDINRVPWTIAGSCNGYFKPGRSFNANGASHNGVLVALCNAMDVPVTSFGHPEYGGELPGIRG